jgi:hypothetical protein
VGELRTPGKLEELWSTARKEGVGGASEEGSKWGGGKEGASIKMEKVWEKRGED